MTSEQVQAFSNSAGVSPAAIAIVVAMIVAAVGVLWAADMVRRLGIEGLHDPRRLPMLLLYKLRVLIIVLLLIYLLT
ncbi:DUF3262 family protein [Aromatoleum bremense]|uniref:DUF3262 family protein n=1 Tax=Aromatoleum bremense TaxID=76115 RepID=A0ABX1NW80_9RHOO|nr:DUF3262 family protein [Aromatoleum bremense]NMG16266.1 DUF3262 family protein [Aromatoleum bremense]QTQ30088.1 putative protein DUf3262 [Aromatoleum bremense]